MTSQIFTQVFTTTPSPMALPQGALAKPTSLTVCEPCFSEPYFGVVGGRLGQKMAASYQRRISGKGADKAFNWLSKTRTRELLIEDIFGFALFRTLWDVGRGFIYDTGEWNWGAGRERLFREGFSIFSDLFAGGIAAVGIGAVLDKALKGFSNSHIHFDTLELFKDTLKPQGQSVRTESEFMDALAEKIASAKAHGKADPLFLNKPALKNKLNQSVRTILANNNLTQLENTINLPQGEKTAWGKWFAKFWHAGPQQGADLAALKKRFADSAVLPSAKQLEAEFGRIGLTHPKKAAQALLDTLSLHKATRIAKALKLQQFDVMLGKHHVQLPELVTDLYQFLGEMAPKNQSFLKGIAWEPEKLLKRVKTTVKIKHAKLAGLLVALGCTMASPLINHWITKKIDGADHYLALDGLYAAEESKALNKKHHEAIKNKTGLSRWLNENGPYVFQQLRDGNRVPLISSIVPLTMPFWFDSVNRRAFVPTFKKLRGMLDFGKKFPFMRQQQIASLYAFLIAARIYSSRNQDEYRERTLDSVLGYGLWILGTPLIKNAWASKLGKNVVQGVKETTQNLVKRIGPLGRNVMMSEGEMNAFVNKVPKGVKNALNLKSYKSSLIGKEKLVNRSALFFNILLLGLIEPFIALTYTQYASKQRELKHRKPLPSYLFQQATPTISKHASLQDRLKASMQSPSMLN